MFARLILFAALVLSAALPVRAEVFESRAEHAILMDADTDTVLFNKDADVRMPEIGRSVVHEEGVALIREWINSQSGACE